MKRIWKALLYSLKGLRTAVAHETAFQQELLVYLILLIPLYYMPLESAFKGLLLLANTAVLVVELLNSAVESVVDLVTPEYAELAGRAKDIASAAAFLSQLAVVILWIWAILRIV